MNTRNVSQDQLRKKQQKIAKLKEAPGPITYTYDMDTIARRTVLQKRRSGSDSATAFNAQSKRFAQARVHTHSVQELPGPGAYFKHGLLSSFDQRVNCQKFTVMRDPMPESTVVRE